MSVSNSLGLLLREQLKSFRFVRFTELATQSAELRLNGIHFTADFFGCPSHTQTPGSPALLRIFLPDLSIRADPISVGGISPSSRQ